jgi:hypothetical protein
VVPVEFVPIHVSDVWAFASEPQQRIASATSNWRHERQDLAPGSFCVIDDFGFI